MRRALLASVLLASVAAGSPAAALPWFGKKAEAKPAAAPAAAAKMEASAPKPSAPRKATAVERATADRLDPLARATFWSREVEVDPGDVQAGLSFSAALRTLGKYPEAANAAQQVLVVDPKNYEALLAVAKSEIAGNRAFYALDSLKKAKALQPNDWRPVSLEGVALEQTERPAEARAAYARALTLSPNNPAVLTNLALSYASAGDKAKAEQLLRTAIAQPGAGVRERQNLALLLGLSGRLTEAEQLMRQDLPPEIANNNLAYFRGLSGSAGGGRSWDAVRGAEAAMQR